MIKIVGALSISLCFQVQARDYLCFLHGAQGDSEYMLEGVAPKLRNAGVPFISFQMNVKDEVQQRAASVAGDFGKLLKTDPSARCHLIGYSMGGLVARYLVNHSTVIVDGIEEDFRDRVLSLATTSSPHFGTPFAQLLKDNYPGLMPALESLSEEGVVVFNDPHSEFYSPEPVAIPTMFYSTFVKSKSELVHFETKLGYAYLEKVLTSRGDDPSNDGLVPASSMSFGERVEDLRISHYFLSHQVPGRIRAYDFLLAHWKSVADPQVENFFQNFFELGSLMEVL